MGFRKVAGILLAELSQFVPFLDEFGPVIGRAIAGDRGVAAEAKIQSIADKGLSTITKFNQLCLDVQKDGLILGDAKITNEDKARMLGSEMGRDILEAMDIAGMKLDGDQQAKFESALTGMGGNWADMLDCFKKK